MNKLQFIAISLPFGLWVSCKGMLRKANGLHLEPQGWVVFTDDYVWPIGGVKPIVRKLDHAENFKKLKAIELLGYISTHQDVFGLLGTGDAIDCLELAVNPYEK